MDHRLGLRRPRRPPRLTFAMAVGLVAVAGLLAACVPAPATISDPREILRLTAERFAGASSVHATGTLDGTVNGNGVGGIGGGGGGLPLTGTRLEADLVMTNGNASAHVEIPALLGLTLDLRRIGTDVYVAATTMSRGWHRFSGGNDLPFGVGKPAAFATALAAWLQRPGVVPVRLDDASCGSGTCYQLRLDVSSTELAPILAAASGLGGGLAASSAQVVLLVDRATLDLSDMTLAIDLGATGKVTAAMRFSRWNADVTIPPPPANEIVENA